MENKLKKENKGFIERKSVIYVKSKSARHKTSKCKALQNNCDSQHIHRGMMHDSCLQYEILKFAHQKSKKKNLKRCNVACVLLERKIVACCGYYKDAIQLQQHGRGVRPN